MHQQNNAGDMCGLPKTSEMAKKMSKMMNLEDMRSKCVGSSSSRGAHEGPTTHASKEKG